MEPPHKSSRFLSKVPHPTESILGKIFSPLPLWRLEPGMTMSPVPKSPLSMACYCLLPTATPSWFLNLINKRFLSVDGSPVPSRMLSIIPRCWSLEVIAFIVRIFTQNLHLKIALDITKYWGDGMIILHWYSLVNCFQMSRDMGMITFNLEPKYYQMMLFSL